MILDSRFRKEGEYSHIQLDSFNTYLKSISVEIYVHTFEINIFSDLNFKGRLDLLSNKKIQK